MDTNFYGAIKFVNPIVKRMAQRRHKGRIILVGDSNATHYSVPGFSAYACSKAALEQLAYQLRAEFSVQEIGIHLYLPPIMKTVLRKTMLTSQPKVTEQVISQEKGMKPEEAC